MMARQKNIDLQTKCLLVDHFDVIGPLSEGYVEDHQNDPKSYVEDHQGDPRGYVEGPHGNVRVVIENTEPECFRMILQDGWTYIFT